ncbi:hypothetical protein [Spiroplasma ixodetis]|uniref:hypothetical protein n=1 Tax=Spiroplasma ixodetis TaxID=2141 RepID=UPI002574F078|nr:hypothetical protein [Spiroplasma ixodetis]
MNSFNFIVSSTSTCGEKSAKNLISHIDNKNSLNQKYNLFKEKLNNLLNVLEIIKENKDKKIYFNEKYNVVLEYINQTIEYEKDLFQKFYCENKSLVLTNGIVEEIQNLINGMTNQISLPGKLNIFKTFNLRSNLVLNFRNIFSWNTVYSKRIT